MGSLLESVSPVLSVIPRVPKHDDRHLLVYDGERVLVERTGEIHPLTHLPLILLSEQPAIVICENATHLLGELNYGRCARHPGWQYKLSLVERRSYRQHKVSRPTATKHLLVSWFGWKTESKKANHYHHPIDPVLFTGSAVSGLRTKANRETDRLYTLLAWGIDMREWCHENGLRVSSSGGGLAVQLLRDPRFYPTPRRKVPRATNDKARPHLPGNHYELHTPPYREQDAYYLDMASAHHFCASRVALPHANGLYARGKFRKPVDSVEDEPFTNNEPLWIATTDSEFERICNGYGLLQVRLESQQHLRHRFTLPYLKKPGVRIAWIYTNELPLIDELGGKILGIDAAWVSWQKDTGIPKFAEWAIEQNRTMSAERKKWCKPALLSVYGMLAHSPHSPTIGYRESERGVRQSMLIPGGGVIDASWHHLPESESKIANVIQRGMIEAEVRVMVIQMARELTAAGAEVLALYADSVIVKEPFPLTLLTLRSPWGIKTDLPKLQFFNPVSFSSAKMTKLPGIPMREDLGRERVARLKREAATFAQHAGALAGKRPSR